MDELTTVRRKRMFYKMRPAKIGKIGVDERPWTPKNAIFRAFLLLRGKSFD